MARHSLRCASSAAAVAVKRPSRATTADTTRSMSGLLSRQSWTVSPNRRNDYHGFNQQNVRTAGHHDGPGIKSGVAVMAVRASSSTRLEPLRSVDAGVLNIAYYEAGPADGR